MLLRDIGSVASIPHIDQIPLVERDHTTVSSMEFLLAHTTLKTATDLETADTVFEFILDEIRMATLLGEIEDSRLAKCKVPYKPLLLSKFLDMMEPFVQSERQAILFALATETHLRDVVMNSRKSVAKTAWEPFVAMLLRAVTPHIYSPYLFWKLAENGEAVPLLDLEVRWEDITGKDWDDFQASFGEIILYMPPDNDELAVFAL